MSSSSSLDWNEDDLVTLLSSVLLSDDLEEEIDGLDEDLVQYIAGLLSTQLQESSSSSSSSSRSDATAAEEHVLEESMVPFLESIGCPNELIDRAKTAVLEQARVQKMNTKNEPSKASSSDEMTAKKLRQGIVNMASTLTEQSKEEAERYLMPGDTIVKANANVQKDAYSDKTSAKDKRKQRQELEKVRRDLERANAQHETSTKSGISAMVLPTVKGKDMDINVQDITLSLDNGTVLMDHGDLKFAYKRRYAIIGENGVGKTTLLNRIANWEDLEGFPRHLRVLHVKQEMHTDNEETTVMNAVLESDIERMTLLKEEKEILARLEGIPQQPPVPPRDNDDNDGTASATTTTTTATTMTIEERQKVLATDDAKFGDDLKQLKDIYERLTTLGADTAESRAIAILTGLQFTEAMQHSPLKSLSGGWRMRTALAAALLIEPDLLMLDEPTNHLDLEAVLYLETHLQSYPHTVLCVSHDRGFLNEVCTDMIEFKDKKLTYYRGNFDTYVKLKHEKMKNAMREYQAYQSKREHMMEFIDKFRANAKRATMVQSRIKTVEKMDTDAPVAPEMDAVWRFSIPSSEPLGRPIISIDDVSFDYFAEHPDGTKKKESEYLLQKVNFGVDNASKIAILGANGQGKTTLLNLIMGHLRPLSGGVTINSGLRIGHFTQHHSERFDLNLSAIENMLNIFENAEDQEMRGWLGRFQIQGTDALKPMRLLSGGQKSRVSFAVLAYQRPHLLIIDEGSNHLSMDAVDALVQAIQDFKGGILVVSHDQHFVNATCQELWVVENGHANRFRGTFDDYKAFTAEKTRKRVEETVKKLGNMSK